MSTQHSAATYLLLRDALIDVARSNRDCLALAPLLGDDDPWIQQTRELLSINVRQARECNHLAIEARRAKGGVA